MSVVGTARPSKASIDKSESGLPLSEQAFRTLRRRILRGELVPGEKLRMEVLQQDHSLSSSPLREALNRLVAEGLVIADDHRGFRVAEMSPEDLEDITNLRLLLEPETLGLSIAHGDDEWEGRVVSAYHQLERLEERIGKDKVTQRDDEWSERHRAYHLALLSAAPSRRMLATCTSLYDQAERYRWFSILNRTRPRNTAEEHRKLMDAVIKRRTDVARSMLREHILLTTRNVLTISRARR